MFQNQSTDFANGASRSANTLESSQIGTSRAIFKGEEDIGGGTKAIFLYEMDFDSADQGSSPYAGEIYVGLSGNLGTLKMGSPNTPSLTTQGSRSSFTTKIGGGRSGFLLSGGNRTRYSDSIQYETPTFGGFKAALNYIPKVAAQTTLQGYAANAAELNAVTDIGAFYSNGPIAAGISNFAQKDAVSHTTAFASYTVGAFKGTLGFHALDNKAATVGDRAAIAGNAASFDGTTYTAAVAASNQRLGVGQGKSQGYNFNLDYSVTPVITVFGNIARTNDKTAFNRDLELVAIGARYDLSKRTSLHARYISEKRDNVSGVGASAGVATALKTTLVGIQHNF